uniref:NADH dehydrogenase subunit 2 n=1 Tax=Symbiochloris sp. SG-2018 TaxID=2126034 RepID=A0A976YDD9_9CHLO|nr:NADH dehydrogenase subunit 2 [Symbiochloris sp. SG-2018]UVF37870.1 NADH dehydrogenase subunit 2 [Symbiochloris sp. SG-2018]
MLKHSLDINFLSYVFENDFMIALPEIFFLLAISFLLIFGLYFGSNIESKKRINVAQQPQKGPNLQKNKRLYTSTRDSSFFYTQPALLNSNICRLALLSLGLTFILYVNSPITEAVFFYNSFINDFFTLFLKLFLIVGACSVLMIGDFQKLYYFESIILILFSIFGQLTLISSYNLIILYLSIELQSLSFYVLAASKNHSEFSTEAGIKYFLLGAFSSAMLLYGISLVYGFTGTIQFQELWLLMLNYNKVAGQQILGCLFGFTLILLSFLFKITAAPFHAWAPDVYEGAPTSITALFAIVPKIALFGVFLRLFMESTLLHTASLPAVLLQSTPSFLSQSTIDLVDYRWLFYIIMGCSIVSMLLGCFGALSQTKIKRLLAFSSITNVGYLLMGVSCISAEGLNALLIHLILYVLMTINLFTIILLPIHREHLISLQRIKYLSDLSNLFKTHPILATSFAINLLSLAGIPPLAGFLGKYYLLVAAIHASLYVLAFVAAITTVISTVYYIRLIKVMYFEPLSYASEGAADVSLRSHFFCFHRITKDSSYVLAVTLLLILTLFFMPNSINLITYYATLQLSL